MRGEKRRKETGSYMARDRNAPELGMSKDQVMIESNTIGEKVNQLMSFGSECTFTLKQLSAEDYRVTQLHANQRWRASRFSELIWRRGQWCAGDKRGCQRSSIHRSITGDFAQPTTATDQILIMSPAPLFLPHRHHPQASHPIPP